MPAHNIDCLTYLQSVPNDTFDLNIADPPYFEICGNFDFVWKDVEEYLDWAKKWILECHRTLKETGSFYLWGGIGYGRGYPLFKLCDWIETQGLFIVQNWITQRNCRGFGTKQGYMAAREELVFMTKSERYTWNTAYTEERVNRTDMGADGKPRTSEYKRVSDVWIDISEASQSSLQRFRYRDGTCFPTVKNTKLCERIIEASSNVGDHVMIPFGGSGSEAVACSRLGRWWELTEIDSRTFDEIIVPRVEAETKSDGIVFPSDEELTSCVG